MIHLRTFNLEKIDKIRHYSLLMALDRDKQVQGDISHHLFSWLTDQILRLVRLMYWFVRIIMLVLFIVFTFRLRGFWRCGMLFSVMFVRWSMGDGEKILAKIIPHLIEKLWDYKMLNSGLHMIIWPVGEWLS